MDSRGFLCIPGCRRLADVCRALCRHPRGNGVAQHLLDDGDQLAAHTRDQVQRGRQGCQWAVTMGAPDSSPARCSGKVRGEGVGGLKGGLHHVCDRGFPQNRRVCELSLYRMQATFEGSRNHVPKCCGSARRALRISENTEGGSFFRPHPHTPPADEGEARCCKDMWERSVAFTRSRPWSHLLETYVTSGGLMHWASAPCASVQHMSFATGIEALSRSCGVRLRAPGGDCRQIPFDKAELWCPFTSTRRRLQAQAETVCLNALAGQPCACSSWNEDVAQVQEWPVTSQNW